MESDNNNFAIPYESITRVEMERKGGLFPGSWIIFTITDNEKKLIPENADFVNIQQDITYSSLRSFMATLCRSG